ncbi:hypothetical protein NDU88_006151, partial [Pleurodeles waltl]
MESRRSSTLADDKTGKSAPKTTKEQVCSIAPVSTKAASRAVPINEIMVTSSRKG